MIRWNEIEIFETLDELVHPEHTALVMWDFAKGIVGNAFNSKEMTARAAKLLESARKNGVRVIYSQQNNMRIMGDTGAPTIRMRMKQWNISDLSNYRPSGGAIKGSPLWEIVDELKPLSGEIVLEKFLPNAFLGTCFEWWLRKFNTKTIILAGIDVATGIDGTAREAINRGYYAVVARDCVGTRSEEHYEIALSAMEKLFDVFESTKVIDAWNSVGK